MKEKLEKIKFTDYVKYENRDYYAGDVGDFSTDVAKHFITVKKAERYREENLMKLKKDELWTMTREKDIELDKDETTKEQIVAWLETHK